MTVAHHPNAGSHFLKIWHSYPLTQKSPPLVPVFCWFSLVHLNSLIHSLDLRRPGKVDNQLAMEFEASRES
jgi:hypothetical protein